MKILWTLLLVISLAYAVSCSDSGAINNEALRSTNAAGRAEIVLHGRAHNFDSVDCFEGFDNEVNVVLKNKQMRVELSQLRPSDNTWAVKYFTVLEKQLDDEYFSRVYDLRRSGNRIMGSATIERGTLPRDLVEIGIFVECQDL